MALFEQNLTYGHWNRASRAYSCVIKYSSSLIFFSPAIKIQNILAVRQNKNRRWAGFGPWALVGQHLLGDIVNTCQSHSWDPTYTSCYSILSVPPSTGDRPAHFHLHASALRFSALFLFFCNFLLHHFNFLSFKFQKQLPRPQDTSLFIAHQLAFWGCLVNKCVTHSGSYS